MKLDDYDKKILYELDKKSNIRLSALSKKLGKSKQFISHRLKNLEKEKVILSYNAIIDMSKLGYTTYRLYFKMKQITSSEGDEFISYLKEKYSEIWTIAQVYGKWDYAMILGVKTITEFHKIWNKILSKYKNKIKKIQVAIYSPVYNFNKKFLTNTNEERTIRVYGISEKIKFDITDEKIIKEYAKNTRIPLLKLSEKLKLSPETIKSRIKKLEKNKIICGYKLTLDLSKIGYERYRLDLELTSTEKNKELFEYCKNNKNIYQIIKSIGGADYELEVAIKNNEELIKLIDKLKVKFKPIINDIKYFGFSNYYFLTYIPG